MRLGPSAGCAPFDHVGNRARPSSRLVSTQCSAMFSGATRCKYYELTSMILMVHMCGSASASSILLRTLQNSFDARVNRTLAIPFWQRGLCLWFCILANMRAEHPPKRLDSYGYSSVQVHRQDGGDRRPPGTNLLFHLFSCRRPRRWSGDHCPRRSGTLRRQGGGRA